MREIGGAKVEEILDRTEVKEKSLKRKGLRVPLLWRDLQGQTMGPLYKKRKSQKNSCVYAADNTLRPQRVPQAIDRDHLATKT